MQETVKKIQGFITKLVIILENEVDEINTGEKKSAINTQKTITDILNKLVNLLVQLNKLSKEDYFKIDNYIAEEDEQIIARFISKKERDKIKNQSSDVDSWNK